MRWSERSCSVHSSREAESRTCLLPTTIHGSLACDMNVSKGGVPLWGGPSHVSHSMYPSWVTQFVGTTNRYPSRWKAVTVPASLALTDADGASGDCTEAETKSARTASVTVRPNPETRFITTTFWKCLGPDPLHKVMLHPLPGPVHGSRTALASVNDVGGPPESLIRAEQPAGPRGP